MQQQLAILLAKLFQTALQRLMPTLCVIISLREVFGEDLLDIDLDD